MAFLSMVESVIRVDTSTWIWVVDRENEQVYDLVVYPGGRSPMRNSAYENGLTGAGAGLPAVWSVTGAGESGPAARPDCRRPGRARGSATRLGSRCWGGVVADGSWRQRWPGRG